VQESITNTVRYAQATHVVVLIRADTSRVEVSVVDDGLGAAVSAAGGRGIVGMRERVLLLGGRFEAAPRAAGGFAVRAEIPLRGER
jgi:signal transduction histidine kinase